MRMLRNFRAGAAALALVGQCLAEPVTWQYDAKIALDETAIVNGDGSVTYALNLTNLDVAPIWLAGFYTGAFQARDLQSSLGAWELEAYTQYIAAGEDWSLPDAAEDSWVAYFYDADASGSLAAGQSATVGFTLDGALSESIRFGYSTTALLDPVAGSPWNTYSAVGPATVVPEPSANALFAMGVLLLGLRWRQRKTASALASKTAASATSATVASHSVRALAFAALTALLALAAAPGAFAASDVVISQVYGGGGNSGATLTHDFVELHNRGAGPVDVTGWSVQYASAAGTTWQRTLLSGVIPAGGYYLVQEAQGAGGTQPLPAPDATGTIAMSATAGKVALSAAGTLLTGSCPAGLADLKDLAGYGTANCFEGTGAAPGLSNPTADLRGGQGCTDTDDNAADFATGLPTPRNSASTVLACPGEAAPQVAALSPVPGSAGAGPATNVVITFSEPVLVAGTWFQLAGSVSGEHAAAVTGGPAVYTLDPAEDFLPGETVTVNVFAAQVSDVDLLDPPDHPAADYTASFRAAVPVRIAAIQGRAHLSPLANQDVAGVTGIVTGKIGNGFWMQDPDPDSDPSTSDALFVFTSSAPAVETGDAVRVSGRVSEFRPGGATGPNLTITELASPVVQVLSHGNALPAAILLGIGGRTPPTSVIDDDAAGSVETGGSYDPDFDGIDFYESLEGMRVKVSDPVVVGPRNGFGEFLVLGDAGAGASLRTGRGGIKARPADFNPERIMIDDAIAPTPTVDVGDAFAGAIEGILDYQFGNFKILPAALPAVIAGQLSREVTPAACQNMLSVATFNVENLDAGDPQEKFDRLAVIIVQNLRSPLLVALEEMQDNNGAVNDGTVDASQTAARLTAAILAAGGPQYQYRDIAPQNLQDGGEPGGNIRVGFLFQADAGLVFVPRPGGTATAAVKAVKTPTGVRLNFSPGRIDPLNPAFANSRKPLVGEFTYHGRTLFVIANHFNSKGGDQPLFGRFQPPERVTETQRKQQAQLVNAFAASILALDTCARIVVLGDINDFEFSEAMQVLKGNIFTALIETLPESERYSYVFEGNSQSLDHILASKTLAEGPGLIYDIVHVNAEFADQASDHDPQLACFEKGPPNCRVRFP